MKLQQLLKAHFGTNGPTPMGRGFTDYILTPKLLKVYEEELLQCVEFNGSKIIILSDTDIKSGKPERLLTGHDEDGIPRYEIKLSTVTTDNQPIVNVKLGEKIKFAPVIKIFSISLGPEMFDPQDIFTTKVDTVCITPSIYDRETFEPTKRVIITFSPEVAQDDAMKELKKDIVEKEKDENKPEFTIQTNVGDDVIKEHEKTAENFIESVSKDVITEKIQEKENEYIKKLLDMAADCFKNPEKHLLPLKRSIIIRLTKDSIIESVKSNINIGDTTVTLN
jgi:hypothetical protein